MTMETGIAVPTSSSSPPPPRVLVIAGSDSSGGAGLEADQKVLAAHKCYAMTATTALTVQNTLGVKDIHVTPPEFVGKQIDAVVEDIGVDCVKIGMLASARTVEVVAERLERYGLGKENGNVVLDPVMVSTSGAQLLPGDAVRCLRERLVGLASLLTPNIPEATLLLRDAGLEFKDPGDLEDLKDLAKMVHGLGSKAVLLKGGHIPLTKDYKKAVSDEDKMLTVDVLFDGRDFTLIESKYSSSKNTHGTGCSLASAIAANIALGHRLAEAVRNACRYVGAGIKMSFDIGRGSGPINHFHNVQSLPFAAGHFLEYLLERPDVKPVWHNYTHHKFACQMADGTLPVDIFKNYLVQDYLYLVHFARTNALAAYKSKTMAGITASAQIVMHIEKEMEMHLEYCKEFGLSKTDIERQKENQACVAYSRWVLDIGQSEDWLSLQIALAPCLLGYGIAATRLHKDTNSVSEGNKYWQWIENYIGEDYQKAVSLGSAMIEENMSKQSPSRIDELVQIFIRGTEMEIQFWDFAAHSTD